MSYQAASIGPQGMTIPSFQDILDLYISSMQNIYGSDVTTDNSSADIQLLSVLALVAFDAHRAAQLAYNNRSPVSAIGAALDTIVKINGLLRKPASFSTVDVTITGTPGTVIQAGVVQDANSNKWDLPVKVTIPQSGSIVVTATCELPGAVNALEGDVSVIVTPTSGWTSVTNSAAASVGQPIETDSQLRARQALSVFLPSQTMLQGTIAAIAAVAGVTRYNVDENPTGATNGNGNPAHSITAVVEGGADDDVANAIYANRGIGCLTNGTLSVDIKDSDTGVTTTIKFSRPTNTPVFVSISIHALIGFTTQNLTEVQTAITNYLNDLEIGESVTLSGLYAVAMSVMPDITRPLFSIRALTLGLSATPTETADLAMAFDHVSQGVAANVIVTQV